MPIQTSNSSGLFPLLLYHVCHYLLPWSSSVGLQRIQCSVRLKPKERRQVNRAIHSRCSHLQSFSKFRCASSFCRSISWAYSRRSIPFSNACLTNSSSWKADIRSKDEDDTFKRWVRPLLSIHFDIYTYHPLHRRTCRRRGHRPKKPAHRY